MKIREPKTIAQSWFVFSQAVIPRDAPAVQREEMQRAFYAGAWALSGLTLQLVGPDDEPDERGADRLQALHTELESFFRGQLHEQSPAPSDPTVDVIVEGQPVLTSPENARQWQAAQFERSELLAVVLLDPQYEFPVVQIVKNNTPPSGLANLLHVAADQLVRATRPQ